MKKLLLGGLKIGISVAILAYLAVQAQRNAVFSELLNQPKQWGLLAAAGAAVFAAVLITFVRWYFLARALGLPMRMREAMRLGFVGYLFNLAPMGQVGGDLIKAVLLARDRPGRRTEAVVSVLFDRALGLYVMFLFASLMILATGFWRNPGAGIQIACRGAMALTALGTVAVVVLLLPDLSRGQLTEWTHRLPLVGRPLARMVGAVRAYRRRPGVLLASVAMTLAVDALLATSFWLIAGGLYDRAHGLMTHLVISPISSSTGVIPLPMGPFEYVLDYFYTALPLSDGSLLAAGHGLVVALGYRIIMVLIATIGVVYYLGSRREVAAAIHEAEALETGESSDQNEVAALSPSVSSLSR